LTTPFRSLTELINYHLRMHKGVELRDIYKLLHQSVFGPEHLGEGVSKESIAKEMDEADTGFEEPLLEPISVDGDACRINLRAAKRMGIAPALIERAIRESATKFTGKTVRLSQLWSEVGSTLDELSTEFNGEDFEQLTGVLREKGFPPFHHSSSYRESNRPAYRVLMRHVLEGLTPLPTFSDDDLSP